MVLHVRHAYETFFVALFATVRYQVTLWNAVATWIVPRDFQPGKVDKKSLQVTVYEKKHAKIE